MTVSPAQAVWAAYEQILENECVVTDTDKKALAAALRAAADQAIPMTKTPWGSTLVPVLTAQESRERILAIADELEVSEGV
jgi:hypothetical protein